jgi:hypothetical protein
MSLIGPLTHVLAKFLASPALSTEAAASCNPHAQRARELKLGSIKSPAGRCFHDTMEAVDITA